MSYTPSSAISRAMFNFDVYSGWQNFQTSGTVRVSVSDSFSYWDYRGWIYSDFYEGLYIDRTASGEIYWDGVMLTGIQEILSIYNQFADVNLQWIGDFDTGADGSPNPEDVGLTGLSDINIAWIERNDVRFAGISGADSDYFFGYAGAAGDVYLNAWALVDTSLELNTSSRQILMHELGHSLGLSHPHVDYASGVPTISVDYAATQFLGFDKLGFRTNSASDMYKEYFSIMTYDDTESFLPGDDTVFYAHTPMILDVIALQQAYGLGVGTHGSGNDTITAGTAGYRTYFDAGGTDTIDLSMYDSGAYLHMGTTITDAQYLVGVAMSAFDAEQTISAAQSPSNLRWFYGSFENVTASVADDWIIGNELYNRIHGAAGDDLLTGGAGNDVFVYTANGNGVDTITDFEIGDLIEIADVSLISPLTIGDGSSLGLNQIQMSWDLEEARIYIGTDRMIGADVTIILEGLFSDSQLTYSGSNIGLRSHLNRAPSGQVWVTGEALQGQVLIAMHALTDADGLGTVTYQWLADGVEIRGATAESFALTQEHVGRSISVRASYVDWMGGAEAVLSLPTQAILPIPSVIPALVESSDPPTDSSSSESGPTSTGPYQYVQSIEQIDAVAVSPDGKSLIVKFDSGETVLVPASEQNFTLGGVRYTVDQVVNLIEPMPVYSSIVAGSTRYIFPETYEGPLDIDYQLIDNTANAVVVGSEVNDFLKLSGSGNKAVDGAAGADIIDGGTGSTFITGGGWDAVDTFFLDGRAPGVSWSTITDFQIGMDRITIWGWKAGVSRISTAFSDVDRGGAAGYTGLTLHFEHLLPDSSLDTARNENLNSITLTDLHLLNFGANTIEQLNAQIALGTNSHFVVGSVSDAYGEHGYLLIS